MKKVIAVVGSSGIVGTDPLDERCWSGSGRSLFLEMDRQGFLQDAIGVESPFFEKGLLALKNFSFDRNKWRRKLNLEPLYYKSLTRQIKQKLLPLITPDTVILQIGAIYDVASILPPHIPCISYHDGNVAKMMTSPFFDKTLIPYAQRAFDWERGVYKNLKYILTMSEYLRQSMIHDFNANAFKVRNIGVGVNFDIPEEHKLDSIQKNPSDIIFVGREFERKGGNAILAALKIVQQKHPNTKLHIIGPKTNPAPEMPGIVHHGFLHKNKKEDAELFFQILSRCSIGVFPTLFDAFGIPVLEMMSYKIPCIATNILAMPEMIIPNKTGYLVNVNDGEKIAEHINFYIENPNVRANHGKQARALMSARYTWTSVVSQIKSIVQSL